MDRGVVWEWVNGRIAPKEDTAGREAHLAVQCASCVAGAFGGGSSSILSCTRGEKFRINRAVGVEGRPRGTGVEKVHKIILIALASSH